MTYATYNTMANVTGSLPLLGCISFKCLMRDIRYPKEATYTTCDDRHCGFTQYTTTIVLSDGYLMITAIKLHNMKNGEVMTTFVFGGGGEVAITLSCVPRLCNRT